MSSSECISFGDIEEKHFYAEYYEYHKGQTKLALEMLDNQLDKLLKLKSDNKEVENGILFTGLYMYGYICDEMREYFDKSIEYIQQGINIAENLTETEFGKFWYNKLQIMKGSLMLSNGDSNESHHIIMKSYQELEKQLGEKNEELIFPLSELMFILPSSDLKLEAVKNPEEIYEKMMYFISNKDTLQLSYLLKIHVQTLTQRYFQINPLKNFKIEDIKERAMDSIKTLENFFKSDHPAIWRSQIRIIYILESKDDFEEAQKVLCQSYEWWGRQFGLYNFNIAFILCQLGHVSQQLQEFEKQIEYYYKCLEICEQIYQGRNYFIHKAYNKLSDYYLSQNSEECKQFIDKDIEQLIQLYGYQHYDLSDDYQVLSCIYADEEDWLRAIYYCNQALEIAILNKGENDPIVQEIQTDYLEQFIRISSTLVET